MKNISLLTLSVSLLTLGACSHPNALPSGYTHHHEKYKSPDPTSPLELAKAEDDNVRLSHMDMDDAVDDLLRKITARAGVSPKPVYIKTPPNWTPFYTVMDSALRKNMRDLGYALSDGPEGAYVFAYSARNLRKPRGAENDGHPNVEMILQVFSKPGKDARLLTEQTGNYFVLGAHGYDITPITYSSQLPYDASLDSYMQEVTHTPVQLEVIEQDPIMPDIEFKTLGSEMTDDEVGGIIIFEDEPVTSAPNRTRVIQKTDDAYGQKPAINTRPSFMSGHVSKKIDY